LSEDHPTTPVKPVKPAKSHREFPLFAPAAGAWARQIRGTWCAPDGVLEKYPEQKGTLYARPSPHPDKDGPTINEAGDRFLVFTPAAVLVFRQGVARQWLGGRVGAGAVGESGNEGMLLLLPLAAPCPSPRVNWHSVSGPEGPRPRTPRAAADRSRTGHRPLRRRTDRSNCASDGSPRPTTRPDE
jgi:hypothetical protein